MVKVNLSLRLFYHCKVVVFDDLLNGLFRRSLSAAHKNLTCKVPTPLFVAISFNPNMTPDMYLLAKLEIAYYICILFNRTKQPNFLCSPLYPSPPTKLGTLPYSLK